MRLLPWLLVGLAGVGCRRTTPTPSHETTAGTLALAPVGGATPLDRAIAAAQADARAHAADAARWVRLADAFIEKARATTDHGFYAQARDAAERALAVDGANLRGLEVRGQVLLADHKFTEAERVAKDLVARAPDAGAGWSILSLAQLELGRYPEAAASIQRLADVAPGATAYSEASYLRWLTGDLEGAVEAALLAVEATATDGGEPHAWCLVDLGNLYARTGRGALALARFDAALGALPGYPPALLGKGRALAGAGKLDEALVSLRAAHAASPSVDAAWALADALTRAGRGDEAAAVEAELLRSGERLDPRTFALWLATRRRDPERAIRIARAEVAVRDDVLTADALAWALFAAGRIPEARAAIERALSVGTRDARMLFHAAAIRRAAGDRAGALRALRDALALDPRFDGAARGGRDALECVPCVRRCGSSSRARCSRAAAPPTAGRRGARRTSWRRSGW